MALQMLNKKADSISSNALEVNARAAIGLQNILKSNIGPKGKLKMLVSGSGDITISKDGCVLLKNMQIEHPTASLIARNAAAQDNITGDGSISLVVFVGELMMQSLYFVNEKIHPRVISQGIEIARKESLKFLESFASNVSDSDDRELLCNVVRSSLDTKLSKDLSNHLSGIIVDAVKTIQRPGKEIDLYMIELMTMQHKAAMESSLEKGLILDHGFRHPQMPKQSKDCFILTCNVSLEYEKTEVNSQFYFSTAEQRGKMVRAERDHVNERLKKIIDLKNKVCDGNKKSFLVVNQKGIDPLSLDFLHKNGIVALRRAKRRNMERLTLAFGGKAVNSFERMVPEDLGFAESVTERTLGEEKYTFITGAKNPLSVTILLKGPNSHTIKRMKDAVRDGNRAAKAAIEKKRVVPGAGSFEIACSVHLMNMKNEIKKTKLFCGVKTFANALLSIPKALASNAGLDPVETVLKVKAEIEENKGSKIGINLDDGEIMAPEEEGVWDNFLAKKHLLHLGAITAQNLLAVDEIIRAGKAQTAK